MTLRSGIPLMPELGQLLASDAYEQHKAANEVFLRRHGTAMKAYRNRWEFDPFKLWSRRWEYPFAGERLRRAVPTRLLDAGSGVTYLPYYLCTLFPQLHVAALDFDASYTPMFEAINRAEGHDRVAFRVGDMRKLPFEAASFDAVLCVSVLEHTDAFESILDEFVRVLRPGGLMVLTFDLSLDGRFELSKAQASALLRAIEPRFAIEPGLDALAELDRMDDPAPLLSTDNIRAVAPELLPWRNPLLKAAHDLVRGHGWTGGFRSKSVYCMEARAR